MKLVDLTRPLDPRDIEKFPVNRRQGVSLSPCRRVVTRV